ncbi:MAG: sensor histidine kinase [Deltaproteobacteria bacterium]|nr:MAG: sensor histidine kinase [Deltaproteobacteria bacterium]
MRRGLRRASAPLILGIYSGSVAALAVLPSALLLFINQWNSHYESAVERADLLARMLPPRPHASELGRGVMIVAYSTPEGTELLRGDPMLWSEVAELPTITALCQGDTQTQLLNVATGPMAWSCSQRERGNLLVAVEPRPLGAPTLLLAFLVLALIVGILTALIVLRVLRPLNEISTVLARVGAGERSVRVPRTGLAELDDLIDRVNTTALTMEQREDEITARIKTAQRVARTIAHEVRNPLQSIEILTRLLVDETDANERRRTGAAIRQEVRGLDQVVARILRRSIGDELELSLTQFNLSEVLNHLYRLHAPRAQAERKLLTLSAEDEIHVIADSALVGRAVENLLLNALQHSNQHVALGLTARPGEVILEIEDDGAGVHPQVAERLFEPNVSHRAGGSGLGLALVKAVADAHGGVIVVGDSSLGGARFALHLPVRAQPPQGTPTRAAGTSISG